MWRSNAWTLAIVVAVQSVIGCDGVGRSRSAVSEGDVMNDTGSGDAVSGDTEQKTALSDAEWREKLTAEQYRVLRKQGTERAFTGEYWNSKEKGTYVCAACGNELFDSEAKYESGTGWPSFYQPVAADAIGTESDRSFFSVRTEVHCARCNGHLGHVFEDGPAPTGLRYCINSVSLGLKKAEDSSSE